MFANKNACRDEIVHVSAVHTKAIVSFCLCKHFKQHPLKATHANTSQQVCGRCRRWLCRVWQRAIRPAKGRKAFQATHEEDDRHARSEGASKELSGAHRPLHPSRALSLAILRARQRRARRRSRRRTSKTVPRHCRAFRAGSLSMSFRASRRREQPPKRALQAHLGTALHRI